MDGLHTARQMYLVVMNHPLAMLEISPISPRISIPIWTYHSHRKQDMGFRII